jgi:hypothetical protein
MNAATLKFQFTILFSSVISVGMRGQGRHLEVAVWPKLLEHPFHELQELTIGSRSSATISSCNNRELLLVPSLPMRDARPLCPSSTQVRRSPRLALRPSLAGSEAVRVENLVADGREGIPVATDSI